MAHLARTGIERLVESNGLTGAVAKDLESSLLSAQRLETGPFGNDVAIDPHINHRR